MLHITNSDHTANLIKSAFATQDVIAWQDILYEGPVQNLSLEKLSNNRAKYLTAAHYGDVESILRSFQERNNEVSTFGHHDEVVLWFEHDTHDQLQLIQILTWFSHQNLDDTRLTLICINHFPGIIPFLGFGQLNAKQIAKLFLTRKPISDIQLKLAENIWNAFTSSDPSKLINLLEGDLTALPYVKKALIRYLREFPSIHNGLTWTEEYILESIASGTTNFLELFKNLPLREKEYFLGMGDVTFKKIIQNLSETSNPLIKINLSEQNEQTFELTSLGKSVLKNADDWIEKNGINCWKGGIQLTNEKYWRFSDKDETLNLIHSSKTIT